MKKIFSFTIALVVFISIFPVTTTNASFQNEYVSVNIVKQAKTNWCWAASDEMAGRTMNRSSTRTQTDIVVFVKGKNINEGGTPSEGVKGANFACINNVTFKKKDGITKKAGQLSFSEIVSQIKRGRPVIANAGYYPGFFRDGGHAVVIYGTTFIDNSSGTTISISYIDPWDGVRYTCTYNAFCDGSFNSREYDSTIYVS